MLDKMSLFYDPQSSTGDKGQAVAEVLERAKPDKEYYALLLGAVIIALGAIFTDSIPALIASMLVAPLAYPILALGLGLASGSKRLIGRALILLGFSMGIVLGVAFLAAVAFGKDRVPNILISFNGNDHIAVITAAASGLIAAYGITKPKVASAITGVAIAVSLMPPLVATGVSLAPGGDPLRGAPRLFLLNVLSIALASAVVFWATGLSKAYKSRKV
jgi:uncharacterized hydrophobic protein (TIGR00271 family)